MNFEEIFVPCCDQEHGKITTKRQVLNAIAATVAARCDLDQRTVFEVLHERERLGSTAIGGGVAIPHGKVARADSLVGCVMRLQTPVDFDAPDNEPVDLVVALLAPDTGGAEHLRVLARLSRMLRDPRQREALRSCHDSSTLRQAITAEPVRTAA
jgi:nitrogen PTS system EIIA component